MEYYTVTVWTVIKRFILGWLVAGIFLVVVSCVKYKEFICSIFVNNTWAWVDAVIPILIMLLGIRYMLKSVSH